MSNSNIYLSVVVAAYNEEAVIAKNLRRIINELVTRPDVNWEIICVNDGSSDRTGILMDEIALENPHVYVLHHRRNFGQGRALRTAFDCCRGDVIVTLDADLSYGPEYIYLLVDELNKKNVEISLASPYMKGGTVQNVPFYRYVLSRWGNSYLARMSHYPISTSTCVVRAYRSEIFNSLHLTSDGMELQLEVLMKASMMGFQVCEVPAHLEWDNSKVAEADLRRVSKMRILRTIQLYLLMGWLSRPAFMFVILSLLMILPGLYMALILSIRALVFFWKHIHEGVLQAISIGLQELFITYTYSIVFCGGLLLIGVQIFAFALLVLQNKYYFEEIYHLEQNKKVQAERNQFFMRNK